MKAEQYCKNIDIIKMPENMGMSFFCPNRPALLNLIFNILLLIFAKLQLWTFTFFTTDYLASLQLLSHYLGRKQQEQKTGWSECIQSLHSQFTLPNDCSPSKLLKKPKHLLPATEMAINLGKTIFKSSWSQLGFQYPLREGNVNMFSLRQMGKPPAVWSSSSRSCR